MKVEVTDNYLAPSEFIEIRDTIFSTRLGWIFHSTTVMGKNFSKTEITQDGSYSDDISIPCEDQDLDDIQFVCPIYDGNRWLNDPNIMAPLSRAMGDVSWIRIKLNMLPHASKVYPKGGESGWHQDTPYHDSLTSIFYLNTNNGYTEFEDGTKVDSVANRLATFPAGMSHRGSSCSDSTTRVVANLNYYPKASRDYS